MKNFFDNKKPALWITATIAAAAVVPAVILIKKSRRQSALFDQDFLVAEVTYQAPFYALTYTPETAPQFRFTEDLQLFSRGGLPGNGEEAGWEELGSLCEFTLDEAHFDNLFYTGREREIARIRRRNDKAWRLDIPQGEKAAFYYLLLQKNGRVYLAYGYHMDEKKDPESRASIIRWLFKLSPSDSE